MLDIAPDRNSSSPAQTTPMPGDFLQDIETSESFDAYSQEQRAKIRAAAWKIENAPGYKTARRDVPGFRLAGTLRSRETVLFYGVTDNGKRLVGSAALSEPEQDDEKDMTAEVAEALLARRHHFKRELGRLQHLTAQSDWLFGYTKDVEKLARQRSQTILTACDLEPTGSAVMRLDLLLQEKREQPRPDLRAEVVTALDPDVREVLVQTRQQDNGRTIDWLTAPGKNIETPAGPKTIKPRLDALRQISWIGSFVSDEYNDYIDSSFHGAPAEMTRQIDEGRSVIDVVAETFEVKKPLINRLRKLPLDKCTNISQIPYEVQSLDKLPSPAQIEATEKGFEDAVRVTTAAQVYEHATGRSDALQGANGNLKQLTKSLQGQPAEGLADMAQYIRDKLVVPAFWHVCRTQGQSVDASADHAVELAEDSKFLEGLTFSQAYKNTAEWHKRLPGINSRNQSRHSVSSWTPFIGEVQLGKGIVAHELCTAEALSAEGSAQDHCVGGYTAAVLDGRSVIFSLRRGEDILSTVEISSREQGGRLNMGLKLAQNFGKENNTPHEDAQIAGDELLKKLGRLPQERIETYLAGVSDVQRQEAEKGAYDRLETKIAQYDVKDRSNVERMFSELSRFLPKEDAREGLEVWARKQFDRAAGCHKPREATLDGDYR